LQEEERVERDIAAPVLRSSTVQTRPMQAAGPSTSARTTPRAAGDGDAGGQPARACKIRGGIAYLGGAASTVLMSFLADSVRRRRPVVVLAAAVACIVVAGAAVAGHVVQFPGIGSADRPATPADALTAQAVSQLRSDELPAGARRGVDRVGTILADSSRLVGSLGGHRVYVLRSSRGLLCVLLAGRGDSCGDQLSAACPITFLVEKDSAAAPPIAYGVARDGVVSVSFRNDGRPVTRPVRGNVFGYQGRPFTRADFSPLTVTLANGRRFEACSQH
jgi:hypothetical protein